MKKSFPLLGLLLFILFSQNLFSQQIYGVVLDENTKEPIQGATVYFDATTIGTSTNNKGKFVLNYNPNIKNPLVISYMGYEVIRMTNFYIDAEQKIYLKESSEELDEVTVTTNDGLLRSTKLKEFIKHLLGDTENGRSCEILNEEDIILRYNKEKKQITAESDVQIIIKNKNLKYLVSMDLNHFEINYSHISRNKKHLTATSFIYYGSSYFQSTEEPSISEKTANIREETYKGSTLHFMRALSKNKLLENGYKISKGEKTLSPANINIEKLNSSTAIEIDKKIHVKFWKGDRPYNSTVKVLTDRFYIDSFGNHSPPDKVLFEGDFGNKRMGDTLPLDYLMGNSQ